MSAGDGALIENLPKTVSISIFPDGGGSLAYFKAGFYALMIGALLLVSFSKVRYTDSDSRAVLLTAEAIILHGTIKLDTYGAAALEKFGYTVRRKNGHYYNYFPLGTSIASLPFVALAHGWGLSMSDSLEPEQMAITCFTAMASLALLVEIALLFLPPASALSLAGLFWFGTSFTSTTGTALWSHNFAVLFALLAICLSLKIAKLGIVRWWHWVVIPACLFLAYLCRPSLSLLAPFTLLFLFTYDRILAVKACAVLIFLLAGFAGFSLIEFHQVLPDYYLPQRLSGSQFLTALYGNLLSPSRGLLVFSPFLALAWLCFGSATRTFGLKWSWLLIGLAWPLVHLLTISRFPVWWGGWSFGPRLMTDALPGLFLLTVRTWPVTLAPRPCGRIALAALSLAGLASIYINSCQALFNRYTYLWNREPDSGYHQELLFDWRYPQFLHDRKRHEARLADWFEQKGGLPFTTSMESKSTYRTTLPGPGARLEFTTDRCFYIDFLRHNWSGIAVLYRDGIALRTIDLFAAETDASYAEFIDQTDGPHTYTLEVSDKSNLASLGRQVWINGIFQALDCNGHNQLSSRSP